MRDVGEYVNSNGIRTNQGRGIKSLEESILGKEYSGRNPNMNAANQRGS